MAHVVLQFLDFDVGAASLGLGGGGAVLLLNNAALELAELGFQAVGGRVIAGSFLQNENQAKGKEKK